MAPGKRRGHQDTVADALRLVKITIPANSGPGVTLASLLGTPEYENRIVSWRIVGNTLAFRYATGRSMPNHAPTIDAGEGWAPPLAGHALDEIHVRSDSAAVSIATLELFISDHEIIRQ